MSVILIGKCEIPTNIMLWVFYKMFNSSFFTVYIEFVTILNILECKCIKGNRYLMVLNGSITVLFAIKKMKITYTGINYFTSILLLSSFSWLTPGYIKLIR